MLIWNASERHAATDDDDRIIYIFVLYRLRSCKFYLDVIAKTSCFRAASCRAHRPLGYTASMHYIIW